MRIQSIVTYLISEEKVLSASLGGNLIGMNAQEKIIRTEIKPLSDLVKTRFGIHKLKTDSGIYYAYIDQHRTCILSTDEEISFHSQLALFDKISKVNHDNDLEWLIQHPSEAIKSKTDMINEKIQEVKEVALESLVKLQERQQKIEDLQNATEVIAREAIRFKQKTTDLKNSMYCPGMFYLFSSIRNFFWRDNYEYDYHPIKKPN